MVDLSLNGIYIYDFALGRNVFVNSQYTELTGLTIDDINAMSPEAFLELFHPEDQQAILAHMQALLCAKENFTTTITYRFKAKSGRWIWCLSRDVVLEREKDGTVRRFMGTFVDVTEQKDSERERLNLERGLQNAQRLESLSALAGGIAHDLNNMLVGILGNTAIVRDELKDGDPHKEFLTDAESAARRAAGLCRQLLAYSGKGRFIIESLCLNEMTQEMASIFSASVSKQVSISTDCADALLFIEADSTQIRQVLMNLVMNASDAMASEGGIVSITTGTNDCDQSYLDRSAVRSQGVPGRYAWIEVSDSGLGMTQEQQQRMFDPFYSTKEDGRGLGMSAVSGIVVSHKGAIQVCSEINKGTTIKVLMPVSETQHEPEPKFDTKLDPTEWAGGTVLVVDDEEAIHKVVHRMLDRLSLMTQSANDGLEALDILEKRHEQIVCVLLDLTMPNLGGTETYREIRKRFDSLPVILMSGYSRQDAVKQFSGKGLTGFIQKPFQISDLRTALAQVLSNHQNGSNGT
ncbi:MAG: two-component system cell cycle sensor histidine kinase/response regulator CckA [Planctomycetota bacterium]